MNKHTIGLKVEGFGIIEIDVSEKTFRKFSKYCEKNLAEKEWKLEA